MILLLDLGNSRIKWALAKNRAFITQGAVAHPDELIRIWPTLPCPERVLGCSVQSVESTASVDAGIRQQWQRPVEWLIPSAEQGGLRNHYRQVETLGADRWAALLGARHHFPQQALVVVSAGTALVVDAVTAAGDYLGGMIQPGYQLMKSALANGTARLPQLHGEFTPFPCSTADAIETGCLTAMTGSIAAMQARLAACGQIDIRTVLSGGDAEKLAPMLAGTVSLHDNLALYGLLTL